VANLFSKWAALAGAGAVAALLARFGGWLVGAAGRLARRLGARLGSSTRRGVATSTLRSG